MRENDARQHLGEAQADGPCRFRLPDGHGVDAGPYGFAHEGRGVGREAQAWTTYLLPGLTNTLKAAALAMVIALLLGAVFGIARLSDHRWVRAPAAVVVEFFREDDPWSGHPDNGS